MQVLVVGCGYVGLAVARELRARGHEVFGLRRAPGPELAAHGIQPLLADITQPESLAALSPSFDWVVHCVSATGGSPDDYRRTYVEGSRNLVAWLRRRPPHRLVYTSSTGVYGQTDGSEVTELSPTVPATSTGELLLGTERLLQAAGVADGYPVVILRVAGIYGPGRGYWLQQFLADHARLEGAGDRCLNMIHRDDVAAAVVTALERSDTGDLYNVVDNEPVTQLELFRWLAQTLQRPLPPGVPREANGPRKRGATHKRVANRKLRAELGWQPQYPSFREGYAAELRHLGLLAGG